MWWSCELVGERLGFDRDELSPDERPIIVRRMLQVPLDQRPEVVALASHPPPKHVRDPLQFVLARIEAAEAGKTGQRHRWRST